MNDAEKLARDLDRLNRMDSAAILQDTGHAEAAEAAGKETDDDKKYRAALEKLAQ